MDKHIKSTYILGFSLSSMHNNGMVA